jgi:hypothetical protein
MTTFVDEAATRGEQDQRQGRETEQGQQDQGEHGIHIGQSFLINRSPEELYSSGATSRTSRAS